MSTTRPYYRRRRPTPTLGERDFDGTGAFVDFRKVRYPSFASSDPVALANREFDNRAAAFVAAAAGVGDVDEHGNPRVRERPPIAWPGDASAPPKPWFEERDLSEFKWYTVGISRFLLRGKALAVTAYQDYFPETAWTHLRGLVSSAVLAADPGFAGTFGPGVNAATELGDNPEGNYDMNQMFLVALAYAYYDELTPAAREHLITELLAMGAVYRVRASNVATSGPLPADWSRAGFVSPLGIHKNIGETENHILMMLATRYLVNQLMYQRNHAIDFDNRRNGHPATDDEPGAPSCHELTLALLRVILRGDFSEYNAKPYQSETRWALLLLCTYAYDHDVRLAARMVLDYVSAKIAVSQVDLRRFVPFRRRNEAKNTAPIAGGFSSVSLIGEPGSDPMDGYFALLAGNLRSCAFRSPAGTVAGLPATGSEVVLEAVCDYRLPTLIHELFVDDAHRRYFQRLHRVPWPDEVGGNRNADNMELYAGSPSYLITAGGTAAPFAIDPMVAGFVFGNQDQQRGVAVTTTFVPTTRAGGSDRLLDRATDVVQFGAMSMHPPSLITLPTAMNYGVAPDFACGHQVRAPDWIGLPGHGFTFFDHRSPTTGPGFYLAYLRTGRLTCLEALDTWLHPEVTFDEFRSGVLTRNAGVTLAAGVPASWTTHDGTRIEFVIWDGGQRDGARWGARVLSVSYGLPAGPDAVGDAGNVTTRFLNGSVLNSPAEAVVEVRNPATGRLLRLDFGDPGRPRRTDADGLVEWAGDDEEVWTDFEWSGGQEGDVCRPYATLAAAEAAVQRGGTVRMVPSHTSARSPIGLTQRFRLVAPAGGVRIG